MNYTHKITFFEYSDFFGIPLTKSFRTTEDVVQLHVRNLSRSKLVSNITVELL